MAYINTSKNAVPLAQETSLEQVFTVTIKAALSATCPHLPLAAKWCSCTSKPRASCMQHSQPDAHPITCASSVIHKHQALESVLKALAWQNSVIGLHGATVSKEVFVFNTTYKETSVYKWHHDHLHNPPMQVNYSIVWLSSKKIQLTQLGRVSSILPTAVSK